MGVVYEAEDTKLAVASGSSAFRVRVWQITSWRRGPRGGRPSPKGASVAYALGSPSRGGSRPRRRDDRPRNARWFRSCSQDDVRWKRVTVRSGVPVFP
jgi:hypothetical protein